jgi:hypothetical protein
MTAKVLYFPRFKPGAHVRANVCGKDFDVTLSERGPPTDSERRIWWADLPGQSGGHSLVFEDEIVKVLDAT